MKIFVSVSAGVTKAKWDTMTNAEKKAYIKKYPNSKYATAGKAKAKKAGEGSKKIEAKRVALELDWAATKDASGVKKAIQDLNKRAKTNVKPGKITPRGINGYPEGFVIAASKEELAKFMAAYLGSNDKDDIAEYVKHAKNVS